MILLDRLLYDFLTYSNCLGGLDMDLNGLSGGFCFIFIELEKPTQSWKPRELYLFIDCCKARDFHRPRL